MAASGFIKLFRQMTEWEWYQDVPVTKLFLHLLLIANYEDKKWKGVVVQKGQISASLASLAMGSGLSVQQVRTALNKLESTGEITKRATNGFTLITICKYVDYQFIDNNKQQTDNKRITNEQQTDNNQITTTKEYKEIYNTTSARTCERDDEKFFAKMRQSFTAWQADACRVLKVDQETLTRYIEEFQIECRAKDSTHTDWKDITTHFFSWGRYHKEGEEKQLKQESYGNNNTNSAGNSRRYWYEPTGQEDYSGDSF